MTVFYVLFLIPMLMQAIPARFVNIGDEKNNKRVLAVFFVIFTVLVALRHESIGNDTRNYIYFFNEFAKQSWDKITDSSLEMGFSFYNKIVSLFTKDSQVYLAITAILVNLMIYPTYKRLCSDASLTIVLFCIMSTFTMSFSGMKQMIAIGIGFIAYNFVRNKKIMAFLITVCVGVMFHTSAFIMVLMYPVYHAKITKKSLYVVVPLIGVIYIFNEPIFNFLTEFVERYTKYDGEISATGAYTMLILFIIFAIFSFLIPAEKELDEEIIGLRNFLLLTVVIQMFAPLHTLAMRMNYYFMVFIPLLIPKIIERRNEQWDEVAGMTRHMMVVFFTVYFFYASYTSKAPNVFPYHFFWERYL